MFRIRRVHDDLAIQEPKLAEDVVTLLRKHFPSMPKVDTPAFFFKLGRGSKHGFRHVVFVAQQDARLMGTAICSWSPDREFLYLDYIATRAADRRGGLGEALFLRVCERARSLKARGLFLECRVPAEPGQADPAIRKADLARMRFYERLGARRIDWPAIEAPRAGVRWALLYTDLSGDAPRPPARAWLAGVADLILRDRNASVCDARYRRKVASGLPDPVRLHPVKQRAATRPAPSPHAVDPDERIVLTVSSQGHELHHVRDRGYCEVPVRIEKILAGIEPLGIFERRGTRRFPDKVLAEVHAPRYLAFLRKLERELPAGRSLYPEYFARSDTHRPPRQLLTQIGYYACDSTTPLSRAACAAAREAVDVTLTAADALVKGRRHAYALVRPPGHHAGIDTFGGFCYLNSTAVGAQYLSKKGPVAILDLDFHHGNGTQNIFYERDDVLTVSIHADPDDEYPYFQGFADERGRGPGEGFNLNLPLPLAATPERYLATLDRALARIRAFDPRWLVLALGFDTAKRDPTGTWSLEAKHFAQIGQRLGAYTRPWLMVQEGGYRTRTLPANAGALFRALWEQSQA